MTIERKETSLLPPFKTKRQDLPVGYTEKMPFTGDITVLENDRVLIGGNKWLLIKPKIVEREEVNKTPLGNSWSFPPKVISFRIK